MRKPRAFTLVELLVVIVILALLMAIMVPNLKKARESAKRAACASNLKQIGVGFQSYLNCNNDRLPFASYLPSISSEPLDPIEDHDDDDENDTGALRISDVLLIHLNNMAEVFQCPADLPGRYEREAPNTGKSYFQSEGSSYEYRVRHSMMGKTISEAAARYKRFSQSAVPVNTIWIMRDYYNFHGKGGEKGSRRYLFIDGHVTDFEQF